MQKLIDFQFIIVQSMGNAFTVNKWNSWILVVLNASLGAHEAPNVISNVKLLFQLDQSSRCHWGGHGLS